MNMKRDKLLLLLIAMLFPFALPASAISLNDACIGFGGSLDGTRCTVTGTVTISSGQTLEILYTEALYIGGSSSSGTGSAGTIINNGLINNSGSIVNGGTGEESGSTGGAGTINNNNGGTIKSIGTDTSGSGKITNGGYGLGGQGGTGTINNNNGGVINNSGGVWGSQTIFNGGFGYYNGVGGNGIITNYGSIIYIFYGSIYNGNNPSSSGIHGTGTIINNCGGIISAYQLSILNTGTYIDNSQNCPATTNVPEFPSMVFPIAAAVGIMFMFQKRKDGSN